MLRTEWIKPSALEDHLAHGWARTGQQIVRGGRLAAVQVQRGACAPLSANPSLRLSENPGRSWEL